MVLKELRDASASPYDLMVVTIKHVAKLPEHDINQKICGSTRDDEMFRDCDVYPVVAWEIKIGLGGVPYLSVLVIHEESEGA